MPDIAKRSNTVVTKGNFLNPEKPNMTSSRVHDQEFCP